MATKEQQRAASKRHYEANKEYYFEKNKKAKQEKIDYITKLREETPCADCGENYPYYVMEFDHLGDKVAHVTTLVGNSWKKLLEEISKCEIVCANCHSARTWKRKQK